MKVSPMIVIWLLISVRSSQVSATADHTCGFGSCEAWEDVELDEQPSMMGTSLLQTSLKTSAAVPHALHTASIEHRRSMPDSISRAYYLNFESSVTQRQHMEIQMRALEAHTGLAYERYPSINGSEDPSIQRHIHDLNSPHANLTEADRELVSHAQPHVWPGVLGNHKTHLEVWQHAVRAAREGNQTAPFALILEDTLSFAPQDFDALDERLAQVPADADIVLLGWWGHDRDRDFVVDGVCDTPPPFSGRAPDARPPFNDMRFFYYAGTYAYLVRLSSVPRLVEYARGPALDVSTRGGHSTWNIDVAMMSAPPHVRRYALSPKLLGGQHRDDSRFEDWHYD